MRTSRNPVSRRSVFGRACAGVAVAAAALTTTFIIATPVPLPARALAPVMTVPNLAVRTAVDGLVTPIGLAFISHSEWLVIEKDTGQVRVVEHGLHQPAAEAVSAVRRLDVDV